MIREDGIAKLGEERNVNVANQGVALLSRCRHRRFAMVVYQNGYILKLLCSTRSLLRIILFPSLVGT